MARLLILRTCCTALTLACLVLAKPAAAAPLCEKRDAVLKLLAHDFAEVPSAIGLVASGGVIELLTSTAGSWTLILTLPTGVSCVVATGDNWASKPPATADAPA